MCCFDKGWGCFHPLPSLYSYISYDSWTSDTEYYPRQVLTPVHTYAIRTLKLAVSGISNSIARVTLYDPRRTEQISKEPTNSAEYKITVGTPELNVTVERKADDSLLLTTWRGALYASEGHWEWNFYLGGGPLFGLGDLLIRSEETRLMYSNGVNSSLPVIIAFNEQQNTWHGVVVSAPGPLEIYTIASGVVTIKSIAAVAIQLDVLVGPTLRDISIQLEALYGTPLIPPYWALGVHICRDYYDDGVNRTIATELKDAFIELKLLVTNPIPFDTHCLLEGLMWLTDDYKEQIKAVNKLFTMAGHGLPKHKFVPSIVPHLSPTTNAAAYNDAVGNNLLYESEFRNGTYKGFFRDKTAVYPAWHDGGMTSWIQNHTPYYLDAPEIDGIMLSSNWPSDNTVNLTAPTTMDFPYIPKDMSATFNGTPSWSSHHNNVSHLSTHNQYGTDHAKFIRKHIRDANKFILSAAYGVGGSVIGMAQNITPTWTELRIRVRRAIGQGLINARFASAPICGDIGNKASDELCIRWHLVGSVFPIFRVRSDRSAFGYSGTVRRIIIKSIRLRYALLPYMYTAMQTNDPLIRPLFYNYPESINITKSLDEQFLVGDALLVAPALLSGLAIVRFYAPEDYYEFHDGIIYPKGWNEISVVESDLPMFIAPGNIIATQENSLETHNSLQEVRKETPYTLIVALRCHDNDTCTAFGSLYIDETVSWTFEAEKTKIIITVKGEKDLCKSSSIAAKEITSMRIFPGKSPKDDVAAKTIYLTGVKFDICQPKTNFTCHYDPLNCI